jgi:D-alanyl-D-alanine carboxypeptidase/D-alanyl-D-alanine-endopeptidase (penicillin-binding protein 4)
VGVTADGFTTKITKITKITKTPLWSGCLCDLRGKAVARALAGSLLGVAGCTHAPPAVAPHTNSRAERALTSDLNRIFNAPVMEQGLWGVEVKSLATGRILYALNARKLMMPASNMKIVTLATAAETLGWDYRFRTTLETLAPIENGALQGDLVIRGSGDPTINARGNRAKEIFDEWAAALKAAGILRIDGAIVGDDSAFDDVWLGQGWSWDYLQDGYAAPMGALELNEDIAQLSVRPGTKAGDPAALELTPGSGLRLANRVVTGEPASAIAIAFERRVNDSVLDVSGSIPEAAAPISRDVAVMNPTLYFAQGVKDALVARGIDVSGAALDADDIVTAAPPAPRRVLHETVSVPLSDIATVMMKVSQNLYAETLLKAVGAAKGTAGTVAAGRVATSAVLEAWGIPPGAYVQADGSGLSRYDFVTADMIATILERLYRDPRHHDPFVATLPVAGKDGTVAARMKDTRAEGNAAAKTGSISNVRALSGYVRTRDGDTLVFSILANSFTIPAATVNWIADLAVETLANFSNR